MTNVVFLDRDGTINVDKGYVHTQDAWEWQPGAQAALKMLQEAGYQLAIVTNQSGVGHELYTEEAMHALHDHMIKELKDAGVTLAAIEYCLHRRDGTCECRKPGISMAHSIEKKVGDIAYVKSWTIGDKIADMQFGKNLGTKTALIRSRYWDEKTLPTKPDMIVSSLFEAAQTICKTT